MSRTAWVPDMFSYCDQAIRHVEKHCCSLGCAVPTAAEIAEFGPGGCCGVLADIAASSGNEPIEALWDDDGTLTCDRRVPPSAPAAPSIRTGGGE